ncbi:helix-turn-helix transcriptional regulator [Trinickia terrae]|uniref:Helix-turn-helix transcriptional regulator n=1 Tax=Trinickia terrae TaxID=2571161 RepID=A0A4U1I9J1_9BURK|nr:helix-turn-helix transcriptional regulator [Trinickia terrae]TKC90143.1 helix-turn-helix transcriptional regulator [Trinickia terrae]
MHSQNLAFGKALRSLRKARKATQRDLAVRARLDRSYISSLELGEASPTLDTLLALSRALGISLTEFAAAIERELDSTQSHPQPSES